MWMDLLVKRMHKRRNGSHCKNRKPQKEGRIQGNTVIGLFLQRNSEKLCILLRISENRYVIGHGNLYLEGRNTANFLSFGHWYYLNRCVTQGLNNVLVSKSDEQLNNFTNLIWYRNFGAVYWKITMMSEKPGTDFQKSMVIIVKNQMFWNNCNGNRKGNPSESPLPLKKRKQSNLDGKEEVKGYHKCSTMLIGLGRRLKRPGYLEWITNNVEKMHKQGLRIICM